MFNTEKWLCIKHCRKNKGETSQKDSERRKENVPKQMHILSDLQLTCKPFLNSSSCRGNATCPAHPQKPTFFPPLLLLQILTFRHIYLLISVKWSSVWIIYYCHFLSNIFNCFLSFIYFVLAKKAANLQMNK